MHYILQYQHCTTSCEACFKSIVTMCIMCYNASTVQIRVKPASSVSWLCALCVTMTTLYNIMWGLLQVCRDFLHYVLQCKHCTTLCEACFKCVVTIRIMCYNASTVQHCVRRALNVLWLCALCVMMPALYNIVWGLPQVCFDYVHYVLQCQHCTTSCEACFKCAVTMCYNASTVQHRVRRASTVSWLCALCVTIPAL